MLKNNG
jgi:hypothetical protein